MGGGIEGEPLKPVSYSKQVEVGEEEEEELCESVPYDFSVHVVTAHTAQGLWGGWDKTETEQPVREGWVLAPHQECCEV